MERSEAGISGRPSDQACPDEYLRRSTDYDMHGMGGQTRVGGHRTVDEDISFKRDNTASHLKPNNQRDGLPPPGPFEGKNSEDADTWIKNFALWAEIRHYDEDAKLQIFPYLLKGAARTWFETQKSAVRSDWETLADAFMERYILKGPQHREAVGKVFDLRQNDTPVLDFLEKLQVEGHRCGFNEDLLISAAVKALKPEIRSFVLQQNVQSWEDLCKAAFICESSVKPEPAHGVLKQIAADVKALEKQIQENKTINVVEAADQLAKIAQEQQWATSTRPQSRIPPFRLSPPPRRTPRAGPQWQQPRQQVFRQQPARNQQGSNGAYAAARRPAPTGWRASTDPTQPPRRLLGNDIYCTRCGNPKHENNANCHARRTGVYCRRCERPNHFERVCMSSGFY